MSKLMLAALLGSAVLLTGCRTVWVHPDASAEKYHEDTVRCQFGISSTELERLHERYATEPEFRLPEARSGWTRCMEARGWSTRVGLRSKASWDEL